MAGRWEEEKENSAITILLRTSIGYAGSGALLVESGDYAELRVKS
jgi:hypothetical protein